MAGPTKRAQRVQADEPVAHVAPAEPPMRVADAPGPAKECCATCLGSRRIGPLLRCHGQPPTARYTNHVMGVGPAADALWPTVKDEDWCMKWAPK
jgi:hypothetical protein